jgi:hypothetical protein
VLTKLNSKSLQAARYAIAKAFLPPLRAVEAALWRLPLLIDGEPTLRISRFELPSASPQRQRHRTKLLSREAKFRWLFDGTLPEASFERNQPLVFPNTRG